jgi:hypothetical protein
VATAGLSHLALLLLLLQALLAAAFCVLLHHPVHPAWRFHGPPLLLLLLLPCHGRSHQQLHL